MESERGLYREYTRNGGVCYNASMGDGSVEMRRYASLQKWTPAPIATCRLAGGDTVSLFPLIGGG
jgi:hypothetical protein